jgi:hypothetical protein
MSTSQRRRRGLCRSLSQVTSNTRHTDSWRNVIAGLSQRLSEPVFHSAPRKGYMRLVETSGENISGYPLTDRYTTSNCMMDIPAG